MAQFCLIPEQVDKFKQALIDGDITPEKLSQASSEDRHKFLSEIVGEENATGVNSLFESKLLLKDQQSGFIRWAEKVAGLKPAAKRDIISKIEKLDKVLSTAESDQFLHDLAATKLGVDVTADEAKQIMKLTDRIAELKEKGGKEYGHAILDLQDYLDSVSPAEKENIVTTTGGAIKALQATADLSAPFRQGRDYFGTKEWFQAFGRMFKYATSKDAYRNLNAEIVAHPLYERADKAKLAFSSLGGNVSKREEQFISKWAKKFPVIANSERAYAGFLTDLRWNRFKNTIENLEKAGLPVTKEVERDLAGVINSGTGRGDLGAFELAAKPLSEAIWSPKMVKSRLDLLNLKAYTTYSKPARIEQWKRVLRLGTTTAGILGLAKMAGADVETDPRSSDFGKIKVGNRRFDVTGGYGGYVRLAAQLGTKSTKSTSTGKIIPLNTGDFGGKTGGQVLSDFIGGKESPLMGIINDLYGGQDFDGNDLSLPGAKQRYFVQKVLPLLSTDIFEAYQDEGVKGALEVGVPALFGVGVQTYGDRDAKTEQVLTDTSDASLQTKVLGFPAQKPKPELQPLLAKMNKEKVTLNLPGSRTTITPPGEENSRELTQPELKEYRKIYQKNIIDRMTQEKDVMISLPTGELEDYVDDIKRATTEQSKNDLIRHMLK